MSTKVQDPEQEPLLSRSFSPLPTSSNRGKWPTFTTISPRYRMVPYLGCSIIFINEAEYFVKQVATMRALEAMYCYKHYLDIGSPLVEMGKHIPERLCKDDSIQKQVARSAGLIMFIRMLCAMIGAIPLGWLADRYGRKVVLVLHKVNVTITCASWLILCEEIIFFIFQKTTYIDMPKDLCFPKVPVWTLYLSGLPGLIGGNYDVGLAMLFASYTDVMPVATERELLFFLTTSMQYLAQMFCPSIGALLMNLDGKGGTPQVNLAVSFTLAFVTAMITLFVFPETISESSPTAVADAPAPENGEEPQDPEPMSNICETKSKKWLYCRWEKLNHAFQDSVSGVGVFNILLLALSIFFATTGIKTIDWFGLIQYPVIKLHWTFPQASYIVTVEGILMLVHFSLLLPTVSRVALFYLGSSGRAHFAVMAGSSVILTVGSVLIGFSFTSGTFIAAVILYLFGEGLPTATQAYIISLIDRAQVARVMATLSMASIGGKVIASVLFSKVLAIGLDTNVNALVGLPFFVSAGLFVLSATCVTVVGLRV